MAAQVKNMLLARGQQVNPALYVAPLALVASTGMASMLGINEEALKRSVEAPNPERATSALLAIPSPEGRDSRLPWGALLWAAKAAGVPRDVALAWSVDEDGDSTRLEQNFNSFWDTFDANKPNGINTGTLFFHAYAAGWVEDIHTMASVPCSLVSGAVLQSHPELTAVPPFRLSAHIQPWSLTDTVKKSHDFLIGTAADGIFPLGSVSVVASPGGMMKTALAISFLLHLAVGQPWAGLPISKASGLLLALEDDKDETTRRLIASTGAQIDPKHHEGIEARVGVAVLSGVDARLTVNNYGSSERTGVGAQIIAAANALTESSGYPVRLIVVDHSRLAIGGDANDSSHVTELTRALAHIAKETGAAVVLLCHSPKSTVNPNRTGDYTAADVLGSGAFVDNARFACVLTTLTDDERKAYVITPEAAKRYVALRIIKSNYSETGRVFYLRKTPVDGWGVVVPDVVTLSKPVREYVPPPSNVDRVHAFLMGHLGRFTKTGFKTYAGTDGPMGIGISAATAALESLIESGRVVLRSPTPQEIVAFNLGRQAKEVLHAV